MMAWFSRNSPCGRFRNETIAKPLPASLIMNNENQIKTTPFNEEFCNLLMFRLGHEFANSNDTELKWFWCDGVSWFPSHNQLTKKQVNDSQKIITEAWIGKDGQSVYQATIHFGRKALSNYAKDKSLIDCIPELESESEWIEIDIENKKVGIKLN